jgi:hypothetical protein
VDTGRKVAGILPVHYLPAACEEVMSRLHAIQIESLLAGDRSAPRIAVSQLELTAGELVALEDDGLVRVLTVDGLSWVVMTDAGRKSVVCTLDPETGLPPVDEFSLEQGAAVGFELGRSVLASRTASQQRRRRARKSGGRRRRAVR